MSRFAVIRHSETGGLGTCSAEALQIHLGNGWVRVSDWAPEPSAFHLPDFAEAPDMDAPIPEPEPDEAPAKTTKKESTA